MPRYFTHYWKNGTWYSNQGYEGEPCNHLAGNMFRKRNVAREDFIYVVTVQEGQLFLGGRMQIDEIISRDRAIELLGTDDLWEAEEQVIAIPGTGTPMRLDRIVPVETVRQLRCVTGKGEEGLYFRTPTELDGQTLRGVRELTAESARILDALIGTSEQPGMNPQLDVEVDGLEGTSRNDTIEDGGMIGSEATFDPGSIEDERKWRYQAVVQRQGQPKFRQALLVAYEGRCAISGCAVEQTLQAAHITRYMGQATDHVTNGLLLRADLHNLFDSYLLSIDPSNLSIQVSSKIQSSSHHGEFHGKTIFVPNSESMRPNYQAMERHFETFQDWEFARTCFNEEELEESRQSTVMHTTAEVLQYLNSL
jgi:hypothetical protein